MEVQVNRRWTLQVLFVLTLSFLLVFAACGKKPAPATPAVPPPPPQPTAAMSASPMTVEQGQGSTLTWSTTNATDVSIEGVGAVNPQGSRRVTPNVTTTYHLLAKGPGGGAEAYATVTVTMPQPKVERTVSAEEMFAQNIRDVYFDYDKYDIRSDGQTAVAADAAFLRQHPDIMFTIEGHCDERGSTDYNIALGDNRANAVKNALVAAGVSPSQIRTVSYGKEKPFCTESNETCWQTNRRGHFVYGR